MVTTVRRTRILDRDLAIAGISQVRQEWQSLAGDQSLLDVQGSVGLLLADIAQAIGLEPEERVCALGPDLVMDYEDFLSIQVIPELLQVE